MSQFCVVCTCPRAWSHSGYVKQEQNNIYGQHFHMIALVIYLNVTFRHDVLSIANPALQNPQVFRSLIHVNDHSFRFVRIAVSFICVCACGMDMSLIFHTCVHPVGHKHLMCLIILFFIDNSSPITETKVFI